jgi:bifunctional non-homologous end joining protein LigD
MARAGIRVDGRDVDISNPDKVLFPEDGITKAELVGYYRRIADFMLPHIRGRPLTLIRHPDGIRKQGFFQKSVSDYFPEWIERVTVEKEDGTVTHPLAADAATLAYLANQAAITLHVWTSRAPDLDRPDVVVFDLDPANADFTLVRRAARDVRAVLEDLGLTPYIQTTGSRGLHVVTPVTPSLEFEPVHAFAERVAEVVAGRADHLYTTHKRKAKREGRLFLDTGRNAYAQTFAAPYTVRTKPGAPVATPFEWGELSGVTPRKWTVRNVFRRLGRKGDSWAGMEERAGDLEAAVRRLDRRTG